jgi:hypothetical protein
VSFARRVRDAQSLARRLGYVAACVEDNIEDVSDFHATVESLVGASPLMHNTRQLRELLSDSDRKLLLEVRSARNALVYDFFIDHPVEGRDGAVDAAAVDRARGELTAIAQVLRRAEALVSRLEQAFSRPDG